MVLGEAEGPTGTSQEEQRVGVHKARPMERDEAVGYGHCEVCGQAVKKVPGGQGPTWIHVDSGAVAAPNPPNRHDEK